jgi:hypothetical protein
MEDAWERAAEFFRERFFVIRHTGRENTRSPLRNGAGLKQTLIVSCYTVDCNYNRSANKSNHPIQTPLLLVTQPLIRDNIINSIEQSLSWEASNYSAIKEISSILWDPKIHSQETTNCFCPEPDESTLYPPSHFSRINLNITFPSTSVFS